MISRYRALWKNLFHRNQLDHDLDEELDAYVEMASAEKVRTGMSPEEAYRDARREMGGAEQIKQGVVTSVPGLCSIGSFRTFAMRSERCGDRLGLLRPWSLCWRWRLVRTRQYSVC